MKTTLLYSVLALTAMLFCAPGANALDFSDPFDNLDNWNLYGTPTPQRLASAEGKSGVFDNNGDSSDKSGAISTQTFGLSGGFTIESDVYLDFSDTNGCYAEAAVGIANPSVQGWGGYDPYIYFSISGMGHSCPTIAAALRGHAYFFGSFTTQTGSETFYPTEENPDLFLADDYAGGWHTLKITVSGTSQIKFYVDTVLVYTGTQNISNTIATGAYPLWLGTSSSGSAGKAYHDDISISTSCNPPVAPTLSSPAANAVVCATSVSFVWADVSGATDYELQIDNNSDFSSPESDLGFTPPTHSVSVTLTDNCLPRYWRVRANNACNWGDWSASRTVTVCSSPGVPTLASPADEAADVEQPIAMNWDDIGGITYYQIQVDTTSGFAHPVIDRHRSVSNDTAAMLLGSTTYYWRVRSANTCANSVWSGTFSFTTAVCNLPEAPSLLTPADQDSGETQPLVLDWADAAGATSYQIQVDNDSAFATPAIDDEVTPSTLSVVGLTAGTKFYWRVRGYNGCGWGDWSDTLWFKTCYMVGAPVLLIPTDGDTVESKPVSFDWETVASASKYRFQVDDTIGFTHPVIDVQSMVSQFGSYDLEYDTRYYWRVQAYGTCGWGNWSAAFTCSTGTSLIVDVGESGSLPTAYSLRQNYPNPFNPTTTIEFTLPRPGHVTLEVFDVLGRHVRTLVDEALTVGTKQVIWDGSDAAGSPVSSGVYFYRILASDYSETRKMVMLK